MNQIKILSLTFLILSYLGLILILVFDSEIQGINFPGIFILWVLGIMNVTLNAIYVDKKNLQNWVLILLVISGLIWVFPPLLFTFFGIPFLLIHLIVAIYLHSKKVVKIKHS
ncbi:hypothetical protein AHMF7605_17055 [Adhaeribacter arboris]|uniref:Uncharacterized protein n=1 Tax=Adhaeribacter arboris TaxID=2072846 RepID=A0A2T2YHW5_9BACT|nr:hypothetical protein AHMF7605_17055 [Adhaeribacter arboris]